MKRTTALAACAALAVGSFALMPAAQAASALPSARGVAPVAAGELTASFTLAQTAAQKSALRSLATKRAHGRSAVFAATQPAAAHRDAVVAWAQAQGFRVIHSSRFLVTVAGPAGQLADALGSAVTRTRQGYTVPATAPQVPAELATHVASVVGLDNRPLFRPRLDPGTFGPTAVRAMSNNLVRSSSAGAGVTVGTVNFSGWEPSDLTSWAADPEGDGSSSKALTIAPGQIVSVPVGGVGTVDQGGPGADEVALDAEAILGAAPAAKQRMYFADGNGEAGSLAIWDQMATDAAAGQLQVVSTSWGMCEDGMGSALDVEHDAISKVLAAGATVFAASGDFGAYDCGYDDFGGLQLGVDYPASDPLVVAVGGTSTSEVSPGSYSHTGWGIAPEDPTSSDAVDLGSSGGGFSSHFTRPSWQPASSTLGRRVPDIAGLADPMTGYWIYATSDWNGDGVTFPDYGSAGGTSLAAPLAAAGLAGVVGQLAPADGLGLGNILPELYRNTAATHDVTGNSNGQYTATAGYDQVTGLGVVDWTAFKAGITFGFTTSPVTRSTTVPLTITGATGSYHGWQAVEGSSATCDGTAASPPSSVTISAAQGQHTISLTALDAAGACHTASGTVFLDTVAPSISALKATYTGTTTPKFAVAWSPADAAPSSGLTKTHLALRDNTLAKQVYALDTAAGSTVLNAVAGHSYTATVTGYDKAGNASPSQVVSFTAPRDDASFRFSGFSRQSNSADYLGSHAVASKAGSSATFTFTGKLAWVGLIKSRSCGYLDVYVDGVRKARVNLYSSATQFRQQLRVATFSAVGTHTVVLKAVGAHQAGASGSNVYADSLTIA